MVISSFLPDGGNPISSCSTTNIGLFKRGPCGILLYSKKKKEDIFPCLVIKNKISYKLTQLNDFSSVLESYKKLLISHDGIIKENILFKIN